MYQYTGLTRGGGGILDADGGIEQAQVCLAYKQRYTALTLVHAQTILYQ